MKKVGSEKPTKASVVAIRSNQRVRPRRRVDADRQGDRSASTCEAPITASVTGTRCQISLSTSTRLMNEKPQSPCIMAQQPAEVALPDRVVEAELHAQVGLHLGRHVGVERHLRERVARREREHREQHDADAEQARQGDQQSAEEVVAHDVARRLRLPGTSRAGPRSRGPRPRSAAPAGSRRRARAPG